MEEGWEKVRAVIRRKKQNSVFSNKLGKLFNDDVFGANGQQGKYLRWKWSKPAVSIVPVSKGKIALAKMFRYPISGYSLEFPRGGIAIRESVRQGGLRELSEEMGLAGNKTKVLGSIFADTGLIQTSLSVLLVEVTHEHKPRPEEFESINSVVWLSETQMRKKVLDGEIQCSITLSSYTLYRLYLANF